MFSKRTQIKQNICKYFEKQVHVVGYEGYGLCVGSCLMVSANFGLLTLSLKLCVTGIEGACCLRWFLSPFPIIFRLLVGWETETGTFSAGSA